MNTPMVYDDAGLLMTEGFEGCCLKAYQDVAGVWTNGYGNTHGVVPGSTITQEQAVADLRSNLQNSVNDVNQLVKVSLTQGEFNALVDFDFNLGRGNFARSNLLTLLNAGDYAGAAEEFERWDKAGGLTIAGLLRRRIMERKEFLG